MAIIIQLRALAVCVCLFLLITPFVVVVASNLYPVAYAAYLPLLSLLCSSRVFAGEVSIPLKFLVPLADKSAVRLTLSLHG